MFNGAEKDSHNSFGCFSVARRTDGWSDLAILFLRGQAENIPGHPIATNSSTHQHHQHHQAVVQPVVKNPLFSRSSHASSCTSPGNVAKSWDLPWIALESGKPKWWSSSEHPGFQALHMHYLSIVLKLEILFLDGIRSFEHAMAYGRIAQQHRWEQQ